MPPQSSWKGYLKLSLVTCPVQMLPAVATGGRVRFRTLNAKTLHPVTSRWLDAGTGQPVPAEDRIKAYPQGPDSHVMLTEEELDSVALDSTRTIDITSFIDQSSLPWIWLDSPHYLMPADPVGEEAFAVIRAAMAATGKAGIARLVMGGRERAVMLVPRLTGIILWTLRFGDEVRRPEGLYPDAPPPDPALLKMVEAIIAGLSRDWSPDLVEDPVEAKLQEMIKAKAAQAKPAAKGKSDAQGEAGRAAGGNVISLIDALRASMAKGKPKGGDKGSSKGGGRKGR